MKTPETNSLISTFLLVALICGGLTLLGSRPAAAENETYLPSNQGRIEQQQKKQQHALAREQKQQVKSDARREVYRKDSKTTKKLVVIEHRPGTRVIHQEKSRELRRDNHAARRPAAGTFSRERSVIHTVSRPAPKSERHDYRRPHKIQRPVVRHTQHREVIVKTLPHGSRTVVLNRERYHTHGGRFYRYTPRGYLLVSPPLGTIVADLPFGFLRVSFGGLDYFVHDNIFYRYTPRGYRVVETPVGYRETEYGPIRVETSLLNIRTGPGLGFDVMGRLQQGDLLIVTAVSPDWYYVLLPNGEYGWIMSRHTSLVARG